MLVEGLKIKGGGVGVVAVQVLFPKTAAGGGVLETEAPSDLYRLYAQFEGRRFRYKAEAPHHLIVPFEVHLPPVRL